MVLDRGLQLLSVRMSRVRPSNFVFSSTSKSTGRQESLDECRYYCRQTSRNAFPMKPGAVIPGLDIFAEKEAPVALARSEYPEWIDKLSQPQISLARLRKMTEEEATDSDKKRYLKLTRRMKIKANNEALKSK
jgi:Mitochondrial ribosomal protein L37